MQRLDRGDGTELAYILTEGSGPTVVFLPGFRSDMTGDKATALAADCAAAGRAMLRLDYSGHGASGGRFEDGTIGIWTKDALTLIDRLTQGQLLLVGSSMGGWIALLAALARPDRVAGLVGIAAAPDFTETLIWQTLPPARRARLLETGAIEAPSAYGPPYAITRALIEDGRARLLLNAPIPLACPVRLLHGQRDADVPWQTALRIAESLHAEDVRVTLVKDGDHRLSRPRDLTLLRRTVAELLGENAA
ncbi:MAG TPA: alpha/beta hydrolase [Acetobacteraceae bacterium]|nr:alpha/beta hydrolase [Acetobacteraceae bacterium]